MRRTLIACSRVCREWRDRSQMHLSEPIQVPYEELISLSHNLERDRCTSSSIRGLTIVKKSGTTPIFLFTIQNRLLHLDYLRIDELDLTREHRWLHRASLFRSVREIKLCRLQPCRLSQLIRFINAFPSLSNLSLSNFAFEKLEYEGQRLSKPCQTNTRSLTSLQLQLVPGVSRLIDWFIKAKPFLTQLKVLILYAWNIEDKDEVQSSFEGVERLLACCRGSVEDLRLQLDHVPMVEHVSDLCACALFKSDLYHTHTYF